MAYEDVVARIIQSESGGNPNARNPMPGQSAAGLGQFIDSTWLAMIQRYRPDVAAGRSRAEILALKTDPALGLEMTQRYVEENARHLQQNGFEPTPGNIYLAHFLGAGGAVEALSQPANRPVSEFLPASFITANPSVLGGGATAADVIGWTNSRMGGAAPTPAATPTAAAYAPAQAAPTPGIQAATAMAAGTGQPAQPAQPQQPQGLVDRWRQRGEGGERERPILDALRSVGSDEWRQARAEGRRPFLDAVRERFGRYRGASGNDTAQLAPAAIAQQPLPPAGPAQPAPGAFDAFPGQRGGDNPPPVGNAGWGDDMLSRIILGSAPGDGAPLPYPKPGATQPELDHLGGGLGFAGAGGEWFPGDMGSDDIMGPRKIPSSPSSAFDNYGMTEPEHDYYMWRRNSTPVPEDYEPFGGDILPSSGRAQMDGGRNRLPGYLLNRSDAAPIPVASAHPLLKMLGIG